MTRTAEAGLSLRTGGIGRCRRAIVRCAKTGSSCGTDAEPGRFSSPRRAERRLGTWQRHSEAGGAARAEAVVARPGPAGLDVGGSRNARGFSGRPLAYANAAPGWSLVSASRATEREPRLSAPEFRFHPIVSCGSASRRTLRVLGFRAKRVSVAGRAQTCFRNLRVSGPGRRSPRSRALVS